MHLNVRLYLYLLGVEKNSLIFFLYIKKPPISLLGVKEITELNDVKESDIDTVIVRLCFVIHYYSSSSNKKLEHGELVQLGLKTQYVGTRRNGSKFGVRYF